MDTFLHAVIMHPSKSDLLLLSLPSCCKRAFSLEFQHFNRFCRIRRWSRQQGNHRNHRLLSVEFWHVVRPNASHILIPMHESFMQSAVLGRRGRWKESGVNLFWPCFKLCLSEGRLQLCRSHGRACSFVLFPCFHNSGDYMSMQGIRDACRRMWANHWLLFFMLWFTDLSAWPPWPWPAWNLSLGCLASCME